MKSQSENEIVSIITPCFNRADLVTETAKSILAQTYQHWEWMIVDDGSTDNSWAVLQGLAKRDSRIRIFQRDRGPKGACVCRNIAVEKSIGKYVIFLDTDDLMAPFCLEQRVRAMQAQPEMDFIIFPLLLFRKNIDDLNLLWNVEKDMDELMRMLINDPICQGTGTLWKKSKFQEVGMWREDLRIWQDVELHIRSFLWPVKFAKRMDLKPDVYLRLSDDSLSRVGFFDPPKIKSRIEVFRYTCSILSEKGFLQEYRRGIRTMGLEIIKGTIFRKQFSIIREVFLIAAQYNIYTKKELRQLRAFLFCHQLRLNKIKPIEVAIFRKVNQITPDANDTVGVVPYTAIPSNASGNQYSTLNFAC